MKKFVIIFLILISIFGVYGNSIGVTSENEYFFKINYELNNLQLYLTNGNEENVEKTLDVIRSYVYDYSKYLLLYDMYNEEVMNIVTFSAKAAKENNLEYIMMARTALINVYKKNFVVEQESNHS